MSGSVEVTENMVRAAIKAGQESGLLGMGAKDEAMRAMLVAVFQVVPRPYEGPRYPLVVVDRKRGVGVRKCRVVGTSAQPGYLRFEFEDGEQSVFHANELLPDRRQTEYEIAMKQQRKEGSR